MTTHEVITDDPTTFEQSESLDISQQALALPNYPPDRTMVYTYDGLYRLTDASYCDGVINPSTCDSANAAYDYDYAYDLMGNRQSQTVFDGVNTTTTTYGYNSAHQVDSITVGTDPAIPLTYDPFGNITDDGMFTYTYDAGNRLVDATDGTNTYGYDYDGLGNRYEQTINGTTTNYLLDSISGLTNVIGEYGNGASTYHLLGLDVIGQVGGGASGAWSYFAIDGLGSVRHTFDANANSTYNALYDPYGGVLSTIGTDATSLGFAGEMTDPTALIYLRARYYNPALGMFTQPDPIMGVMGMSVSYNPYPYAHNNPINLTDPSGRFPFLAIGLGMAAGAAIGAGMDMVAQVADNLANGRGAFDCYDPGSTLRAAAEGALMGGASALIGVGVGAFGGSSVFAGIVAEGADFAFGVGWDMMVYGDSFESAVVNNLLGVGIGFGIGAAASGAGRAWRASGGGVSLSRVTRTVGRYVDDALENSRFRTERRISAEGAVDLTQRRMWSAESSSTFYTVQNRNDASRLRSDGRPWPTEPNRAHLGPGVYAWDNLQDAENYLDILSRKPVSDLEIVQFNVNRSDLDSFRTADLTTLSDNELTNWLDRHSYLYTDNPENVTAHSMDYIIRGTGRFGNEHYFSSSVHGRLQFLQND